MTEPHVLPDVNENDPADGDDSEIEPIPKSVKKLLRTVTPPHVSRPDTEMDVLGWSYFLVLAIILVPFLPFIILAWLFSKIMEILINRS